MPELLLKLGVGKMLSAFSPGWNSRLAGIRPSTPPSAKHPRVSLGPQGSPVV
jgi:hypothetical protein